MDLIKQKLTKSVKPILLITGILTVVLGYLSWCFYTVSGRTSVFWVTGFILSLIAVLLYFIMVYLCKTEMRLSGQLKIISLAGTVMFLGLSIFHLIEGNRTVYLIIELIWMLVMGFSCFYLHEKNNHRDRYAVLLERIKDNKELLLLMGITAIFMLDPDVMQFKWDGLLYYITCNELKLTSLSSLAVYGHVAQTYGALTGLCNLFVGNTALAMLLLNCTLMLCSIGAFYGSLKILIKGQNKWFYFMGTAVYAWSPLLLGMVHYYNLDFFCQCFFTMVVYFLLKRQWIYFGLTSLLFCFTKEPAIVIYAFLCLGILVVDFIKDYRCTFLEKIGHCFQRKPYYIMLFTGILWSLTFKLLGPWSAGSGGFGLDFGYMVEKLKVLYIFQFNWIFTFTTVIVTVFLCFTHRGRMLLPVLPLFFVQAGFTVFSCLFKTVNHVRYSDSNQVTLYMITLFLLPFVGKIFSRIFPIIMSVLLLVSSFFTLDPLTKKIFFVYRMSEIELVTTVENVPLGDGMIYNRQMLGLEGALGKAIKDSLKVSDVIFFPTVNDNAYYFDGMAKVGNIVGNYQIDEEFWNCKKEQREVAEQKDSDSSYLKFHVYQLTDAFDAVDLKNIPEREMNYIYLDGCQDGNIKKIRENCDIMEQQSYHYRGWTVNRIQFKVCSNEINSGKN